MEYLFIDIECCDGCNICEFGYVLTDMNFNIIRQEAILINPEAKYRLTGRTNQKDIKLFFDEEEYLSSPIFPKQYNKIKNMLKKKDVIICAHSASNDKKFLRKACKRYNLEEFTFRYVDSQAMFSKYTENKQRASLENAWLHCYGEAKLSIHKSDEDALMCMQIIKYICKERKLQLHELNSNWTNPQFPTKLDWDKISSFLNSPNEENKCSKSLIEKAIKTYIASTFPSFGKNNGIKKFTFQMQLEMDNTKKTFILLNIIKEKGFIYTKNTAECDYFVCHSSDKIDATIEHFKTINKDAKIISTEQFLQIIETNNSLIDNMKLPDFTNMPLVAINRNKQTNMRLNKQSSSGASIGDILKSQGINLGDICCDNE